MRRRLQKNLYGEGWFDAEEVESDNVLLVYQDTYLMGNPGRYLGVTDVRVPSRYAAID